jgi:hypothetical protein
MLYTIQINADEPKVSFSFADRFSSLDQWHKRVISELGNIYDTVLPEFPKKRWFGNLNVAFI